MEQLYRTTDFVDRAVQWNKPGDSPRVHSEGGKNYLKDAWSHQRVNPGDWIVHDQTDRIIAMSSLEFHAKFRPAHDISTPLNPIPIETFLCEPINSHEHTLPVL